MRHLIVTITMMLFALTSAAPASADLFYDFVFDQNTYNANAGATVDVMVILRETATAGDTARLAPGDARGGAAAGDGLFAFGLNVDFSSATGPPGSTVQTIDDVNLDPKFVHFSPKAGEVIVRAGDVDFEGTEDFIGNDADLMEGVTGNLISSSGGTTIYELPLATLTFTAGAVGSNTTIAMSDNTSATSLSFFADLTEIDATATYGTANIIIAVPEPGSLGILATLVIGATLRRKRAKGSASRC